MVITNLSYYYVVKIVAAKSNSTVRYHRPSHCPSTPDWRAPTDFLDQVGLSRLSPVSERDKANREPTNMSDRPIGTLTLRLYAR